MTEERKREIELTLAQIAMTIQGFAEETQKYISVSGFDDGEGSFFNVYVLDDDSYACARSLDRINGILTRKEL